MDVTQLTTSIDALGGGTSPEQAGALADFYLEAFPDATEDEILSDLFGVGEVTDQLGYSINDPVSSGSSPVWTFITAPEGISWDVANQSNRVDIFGTNNPPVVAGSRGMRDLSLSNALVEGFVRNKSVEEKVRALESLMNYQQNVSDGFVNVPVYRVTASDKNYGGQDGKPGFFIIKDIKIQEKMRDFTGKATRAMVDISFTEVPAYQVNTGRDVASQPAAAAKASALPDPEKVNAANAAQEARNRAANGTNNASGAVTQGVNSQNNAGANSAQPANTPVVPRRPTPGGSGMSTPPTPGIYSGSSTVF